MEKSLVSIITPCYNGEKYLERFLRSILNQTYSKLELILINDGSTDCTEKIVEKYKYEFAKKKIPFIYKYQKNFGQAAALNIGLKMFSGEYLTWIDSDDEILPEFIEKKVEFLQNHLEYAFCYGKTIVVNEQEPEKIIETFEQRKSNKKNDFFEGVLFCKSLFFSGYMVRATAFETVLPSREIYTGRGGQNAQILLPLGWYYGNPGYVEESIYKYYIRSDSHSHSQDTSEKIIQQLYNYENILISTLERIEDKQVLKYIKIVKEYYAKLRFGNAVDSKNAFLIKKYFYELKEIRRTKFYEFALYLKYTNNFIRKIFQIR